MSPPPGQVPDLVAARRRGRPGGHRRAARAVPRPAAADGGAAPRPAAPGARRRLGRHPGGLPRRDAAARGVHPRPVRAVLHLAAVPGRPAGAGAAPAAPRHAGPRRRPRGLDLPRRHARRQHRGPGRPAPGQADQPQPGGDAGRAEDPAPGGAQPHGPARPRDPRPAALRADDQRRRRRGPGPDKSAASKRYTRAVERLKEILAHFPERRPGGDHERAGHRSRSLRGRRRVVPGAVPGR